MIFLKKSLMTISILVGTIWVMPAISDNLNDIRQICEDILINNCGFQGDGTDLQGTSGGSRYSISLSSMVYKGENMLVIESKTQAGCRVLLNRSDLIQLQYLEWCIVETVVRKSIIIQPIVIKQFDAFLNFIDVKFTKVNAPPKTSDEMITFIKNLSDDKIIGYTPKEDTNFISQIKMYASSQLAEHWAQRWSGEIESHSRVIELPVSPTFSLISSMDSSEDIPDGAGQSFDVNDGLDYFNQFRESSLFIKPPSPSIFNATDDKATKKKSTKRSVKRKLFE